MGAGSLASLLAAVFPAGSKDRGGILEVEPDSIELTDRGGSVTFRLLVFEAGSIAGASEQQIIIPRRHVDDTERLRGFLAFTKAELEASLDRPARLKAALPGHFVQPALLDQASGDTPEAFAEAARNAPPKEGDGFNVPIRRVACTLKDDDLATCAFAEHPDGTGQGFILMRSLSAPDEPLCLIDARGATAYDGIDAWKLADGMLTLRLSVEALQTLEVEQPLVLALEVGDRELDAVSQALSWLLDRPSDPLPPAFERD